MAELKPWEAEGLTVEHRANLVAEECGWPDNLLMPSIVREALSAALRDAAPRWVPVGERLPEVDFVHLPVIECGCIQWRVWRFGKFYNDRSGNIVRTVTHWMTLPAPPQEEE